MHSRVGRAVAVAVAVAALVSGCGTGPGQAGSAIILGDTAIPLDVVAARVDTALSLSAQVPELAAQGVGAPELARDTVSTMVRHELISRAAAEQGLTVPDETVASVVEGLRARNDSVVALLNDDEALTRIVRDQLLSQQLGERAIERLAVTFDLYATTDRAAADAAAAIIAPGGPEADLLFEVNPQTAQRDTELRAAAAGAGPPSVVFGVPVGSTVVLPAAADSSNWLVVRVTDRRTDAEPAPVGDGGTAQLVTIGDRVAQFAAADLNLRVNPRYGVWDPVALRVVPDDAQSGAVLPPAAG